MKNNNLKLNKFILNLIVEIQNDRDKYKINKLELNTNTLKYIKSHLLSSTISSDLTAPIRKNKDEITIFGKRITINETLKDGQICLMPSNTIINV